MGDSRRTWAAVPGQATAQSPCLFVKQCSVLPHAGVPVTVMELSAGRWDT